MHLPLLITTLLLGTAALAWAEEQSTPHRVRSVDSVGWHGKMVTVSAHSPRAYLYKHFLTPEECDHIIDTVGEQLDPSFVVDPVSGDSVSHPGRTSTSAALERGQDEVVKRIERRIATVTHIPIENGEPFQVLKYVNGQKYDTHHDYFQHESLLSRDQGGQRIATMLMYLSTVPLYGGGETTFPDAKSGHVNGEEWSECAEGHLSIKAEKGDALLFFNMNLDGSTDPFSMHGSCPTTTGEKYSLTKWMHVYPYKADCVDSHEECRAWAERGECEANPSYMLSNCKISCRVDCEQEWMW